MSKITKNYTPGDWTLEDGKRITHPEDGIIVDVYTTDHRPGLELSDRQDKRTANARLISAAPELVEALIADARSRAYSDASEESGFLASVSTSPVIISEMVDETWEDYLSDSARTALTKAGVLTPENVKR